MGVRQGAAPQTAPNLYLKTKVEERVSQAEVLRAMETKAHTEGRDLTDAERTAHKGIRDRLTELDSIIADITAAEESTAKFAQVYGQHLQARATADAARAAQGRQLVASVQGGYEERGRFQSWGQQFVSSPAFRNYNGHGSSASFEIRGPWLDGLPGSIRPVEERQGDNDDPPPNWPSGPVHSDQFGVTGSVEWGVGQNIMATAQSDGDATDFWGGPMQWAGPRQPTIRFPLLQVIGRVPTTMGSIEYMYWHPETGMAGVVPEGELKPEAELAGEIRAMPVETYAWYKGVTRQALDDIPMIRSIVDTQLRRGVIRRINFQAATALDSDTNIVTAGGAGDDLLAVIRLAMAMVEDNGYSANALLLNALDWAAFDVALLGLGTGVTGQRAFWGLVPVPVPNVDPGTAYVGDMGEAVTFFDRQVTNVLMTDSHDDYFLRNKLVILAEARGRVCVTNAAAVIKCEGTVPDMIIPLAEGIEGVSTHAAAGARTRRAVSAGGGAQARQGGSAARPGAARPATAPPASPSE
jgi:hypothetical protein